MSATHSLFCLIFSYLLVSHFQASKNNLRFNGLYLTYSRQASTMCYMYTLLHFKGSQAKMVGNHCSNKLKSKLKVKTVCVFT